MSVFSPTIIPQSLLRCLVTASICIVTNFLFSSLLCPSCRRSNLVEVIGPSCRRLSAPTKNLLRWPAAPMETVGMATKELGMHSFSFRFIDHGRLLDSLRPEFLWFFTLYLFLFYFCVQIFRCFDGRWCSCSGGQSRSDAGRQSTQYSCE